MRHTMAYRCVSLDGKEYIRIEYKAVDVTRYAAMERVYYRSASPAKRFLSEAHLLLTPLRRKPQ